MKLRTMALKIEIARQELTAKQLSDLSGVSQTGISSALRRGKCSPATVGKLARALQVDVSTIVEEEQTNSNQLRNE